MLTVLVLGAAWTVLSRPGASTTSYKAPPSPRIGFAAPDFTLDTLDGGSITLSELRGRPVMLNFWASWCLPCRTEMPAIERVYQRLSEQGLVIIGLNATSQDSEAAARAFVAGIRSDVSDRPRPRRQRQRRSMQLMGLPSTYFIDREGIVRDVIIGGPMSEAVMLAKIEDLLKDP